MSNRTLKQSSALAELRIAHEAQIEALTAPGLTDEERVRRFGEAAGFREYDMTDALTWLGLDKSPPSSVWSYGQYERSLFADLPGCACPVIENRAGRASYPGIPSHIPRDWQPDRATLECFARVQQEARFPNAR
jgi:hypothetical protein